MRRGIGTFQSFLVFSRLLQSTSLSILALKASGQSTSPSVFEARILHDVGEVQSIRQCSLGSLLWELGFSALYSDLPAQVDELLLGTVAQHSGIALRNSAVYQAAIAANERSNGLLQTVRRERRPGTRTCPRRWTSSQPSAVNNQKLASWTTPPPARVPSALALEFGSSLDVPLALVICSTLQTKKNETRGREAPERSFYLNEPGTLPKMSIYYVEIGFWAPQVKEHEDKTRIEKTMF